jgi:hypothetical protein
MPEEKIQTAVNFWFSGIQGFKSLKKLLFYIVTPKKVGMCICLPALW